MPTSSSESRVWLWSSRRSTTRSPNTVGMTERRMSILRLPTRTVVWPSCGEWRLAMSSSVMTLSRELIAGASESGGWKASTSMPSMLQTDDQPALHRMDVDIRGAPAEGLEEDHVHQPDDGRLPGELEQVGGVADGAGGGLDRRGVQGHFLDDLGDEVLLLLVAAIDEVDDGAARHEHQPHRHPELVLEDVEDRRLHGLGGGADHDVASRRKARPCRAARGPCWAG